MLRGHWGMTVWYLDFPNSLVAMAPHSSTLAWKIPWAEEPAGLQSMGSLRVGHDWATSLSLFTFLHWRRKWQPTPVFLPGESQGRGSLVGCRLWGLTVRHDWSDLAAAAATALWQFSDISSPVYLFIFLTKLFCWSEEYKSLLTFSILINCSINICVCLAYKWI